MALGGGRYDRALTEVLKSVKKRQGVLIILDDPPGFSVQCIGPFLAKLPELLRFMADRIESENREIAERKAQASEIADALQRASTKE